MNYAERLKTWNRCWASTKGVPEYYAPDELQNLTALRSELFEKYLGDAQEVSEFGCGLGHNLVPLIKPGRRLRGFDWSPEAVKCTQALGIEAEVFNMFHPDAGVRVRGALLTVHALEQLGAECDAFLKFIIDNKPDICIHIEPIAELYDEHDAHDAACLAYHRKRGYLVGWLTRLREMAARGKAELIEVRKSPFGGMNHDAYSVIVWRPL